MLLNSRTSMEVVEDNHMESTQKVNIACGISISF